MRDLDSYFRPSDSCVPLHVEDTYREYSLRDVLSSGGYSVVRLIERADFGYMRVYFEEDRSGICRVHDIRPYCVLDKEDVDILRSMGVLSGCDLVLRYDVFPDRSLPAPKWVSIVDSGSKKVIYSKKVK